MENPLILTREVLVERLKRHHTEDYRRGAIRNTSLELLKPSAVLIPLMIRDGEVRVLLTRRTTHLTAYGGDICFPGGRMDPSDVTEEDTCLREAEEEIGLKREDTVIVAKLTPIISKLNYLIHPVVSIIPESFYPEPNSDEVDAVFDLPLERFLANASHKVPTYDFNGVTFNMPAFRDTVGDQEFMTWGLTAFLCITTAVIVFQRDSKVGAAPGVPITRQRPCIFGERIIDSYIKKHGSKL